MTGDATLRSIYSAADETVAALEALNQKGLNRRLLHRQQLESIVARLDVSAGTADVDEPEPRRERGRDRPVVTAAADPAPFVPLPQRTTHGGDFGPKVREKLTAIALERESRRW